MGNRGSKFHPSRVAGHQKFADMLQSNTPKKKRKKLNKVLDLSKPNWSLQK